MYINDLNRVLTEKKLMLLVPCKEKDIDRFVISHLKKTDMELRIVRGQRCLTKGTLFQEWAAALQFPYYFGNNWDAFEECINDLEWVGGDEVAIFITRVNQIMESDLDLIDRLANILFSAQRRQNTLSNSDTISGRSFSIIFQCEADHLEKMAMFFSNIGISIQTSTTTS